MNKLELALNAVDELFGDTSVSPETTIDRLKEVRDRINSNIDAINADLDREEL